jgi:hypothetical protein
MTSATILAKAKALQVLHGIKLTEALALMHVQAISQPVWKRIWFWIFGASE